jgi:hypothetical protein
MKVFSTYCSADKNQSRDPLPAIERYHSGRIRSLYNAALSLGAGFVILSGRYGLLDPCEPIPYYDKRLNAAEVPSHANTVARQLGSMRITEVVFFSRPVSEDPNIEPYIDCIKLACDQAGVLIVIIEVSKREDV